MIKKELLVTDVIISSLHIENKDHGDAKSLVLYLNLYHQLKSLAQLVWNVHTEKKRINIIKFV